MSNLPQGFYQEPFKKFTQRSFTMTYTLQYNKDDSVTVFDQVGDWVGVFRNSAHATKFVRLVLKGELED